MTTSEPTTGEIAGAIRVCENKLECDVCPMRDKPCGDLYTLAADRLESQERDLETFKAFHERYAEQTSKQYVVAVCGLTARAEQAERERDAAVVEVPHTCNTCGHQAKTPLKMISSVEPCASCRTYDKWTWRGLPQEGEGK